MTLQYANDLMPYIKCRRNEIKIRKVLDVVYESRGACSLCSHYLPMTHYCSFYGSPKNEDGFCDEFKQNEETTNDD